MEKRQGLKLLGFYIKIFLFLAITSTLFGLGLSCKKETPSPTPTPSASESSQAPQANDLTNLDPSSALSQITANYNTAKQKASSWQPDAALYSASAKITKSLEWEDVVEVYTFGTVRETSNWWTISIAIRSKNYIRAIIPKEDYLGSNLKPIAINYWKISYVEAFQIAEKNGGKEWREKNKDNYQITATLLHAEPKGYLYWMVEYQIIDGTDKKTVQINANDGEVVEQLI